MPEFLNPGLRQERDYAGPDGNLSRKYIRLDSNLVSLKAFDGADRATKAWAADDVIYLWGIPQGATIHEVKVVVDDVSAANKTLDVGHKQQGKGTWVDNLDAFLDGVSTAAVATFSSIDDGTRHAPVKVDQPKVFLTVQMKEALTAGQQFKAHVYVDYEYTGNL